MKNATVLTIALATLGCIASTSSLVAEDTNGVVRFFAVGLTNSATPEECPDWMGEDSRRLVVAGPEQNSETIVFAERRFGREGDDPRDWQILDQYDEVILDLADTVWVMAPTLHITARGPDARTNYLWLQEVTAGATCETGLDGTVLFQKSFLIAQIDNGSDPDDEEWRIVQSGGTRRICIGIALFSR